jgi:hypothetical protein
MRDYIGPNVETTDQPPRRAQPGRDLEKNHPGI